MYKKLYIRPTYKESQQSLIPSSLALCSTNGELLVDGQILEHFEGNEAGKYIKEVAVDCEYVASVEDVGWGNNIYLKG